ncbi:MAG: hypothetical protein ACTSRP_09195 [Candidatus Helarchaeota archaeon]
MNIEKINFKMVLNISGWIFLLLTGVMIIGLIGPIELEVFTGVMFLDFLLMTIISFGIHSYMKEYPENQNRYFVEWLFLFIFLNTIAFTVYIFA